MWILFAVGAFLLLLFVGMPVGHAMLGVMLVVIIGGLDLPLSMLASGIVTTFNTWIWLAFPLFMMLGYLMNGSGVSDVLVNLCLRIFGRIPGALSHVSVATNVLMAGMSGSCSADAAATGCILIPAMKRQGYPSGYGSMIICGASLIGPLIPPSIALILVGIIGKLSILRLWLGGATPGLILGLTLLITGYIWSLRRGFPIMPEPFSLKKVASAFVRAFPALLLPVVILGGMRLGAFTPTEAGATAIVNTVLIGALIYKRLTVKNFGEATLETVKILGPLMWILGVGITYGQVLARLHIGTLVTEFMMIIIGSPLVFLIVCSLMVLLLGCLVDAAIIIVIFYPILLPSAYSFGIDPIHFSVLFVYVGLVGQSTPPFGPTMFITNAIAECSVLEYLRDGWPLLVAQFAVIPIYILFPGTITLLPNLIMGSTM